MNMMSSVRKSALHPFTDETYSHLCKKWTSAKFQRSVNPTFLSSGILLATYVLFGPQSNTSCQTSYSSPLSTPHIFEVLRV